MLWEENEISGASFTSNLKRNYSFASNLKRNCSLAIINLVEDSGTGSIISENKGIHSIRKIGKLISAIVINFCKYGLDRLFKHWKKKKREAWLKLMQPINERNKREYGAAD